MPALAELHAARKSPLSLRPSARPVCSICADSMVAAEASAFVDENVITYLWACDTCGYGFVTKHAMRTIVCN